MYNLQRCKEYKGYWQHWSPDGETSRLKMLHYFQSYNITKFGWISLKLLSSTNKILASKQAGSLLLDEVGPKLLVPLERKQPGTDIIVTNSKK